MSKVYKLVCPGCFRMIDITAFDIDLTTAAANTQLDRLKAILGERCMQAIAEGRPSHGAIDQSHRTLLAPEIRPEIVEITHFKVAPDEFLIASCPEDWKPDQVAEFAEAVMAVARMYREDLDPRCMVLEKVLVMPHVQLTGVQVPDPAEVIPPMRDGTKPWPRRDPMG